MKKGWRGLSIILSLLLLGSCSPANDLPVSTPSPTAETSPANPGNDSGPAFGVFSQWAIRAEGSSEFANPEWSAAQAIGSPDAPGCGDYQFAWASAASDSIETLEVGFPSPVYPQEIRIHQSFNPDQVVKVEVLNPETGAYYTVLQKNPVSIDRPCPYVLEVATDEIDFQTDTVRITVDQSQLGLGWNEIDAVLLVGSLDPVD